jgi:glycolate dehydrogenase FAD-linked subunit
VLKLVEGREAMDELSRDAGIIRLTPRRALIAQDETEVAEALRMAESESFGVTPRGAGTSIPSQAVGGGLVLFTQMRGAELLPGGEVACGAGMVKAELNGFLSPHGRWMPVDPSSFASCTVGGMVANNSSGARTLKYGSTVDFVTSLRVVMPGAEALGIGPVAISDLPDSSERTKKVVALLQENEKEIAEERPRVTKNSSGYRLEESLHDGVFDEPKLLVGSEGTLGVVTTAEFRTVARPDWRVLFIFESTLDGLQRAAEALKPAGPAALELLDKSVFRRTGREDSLKAYSKTDYDFMVFGEFDGTEGDPMEKVAEVAEGEAANFDPIVLTSASEITSAWELRNRTLLLAQEIREEGKALVPGVEDLVVPPDRLRDLVKTIDGEFTRRGLDYISYGHMGDANLHARPLMDVSSSHGLRELDELMADCFEAVWKMGGSMTGEHGDGRLRAKFVERQYPKTHWIMKEIRRLYDPKGLLNPGVKIV